MSAAALLDRLEDVRQTSSGHWIARCPVHKDRAPEMSIREYEGCVLVDCLGGCAPTDVVKSVGLDWTALFPVPGPKLEPLPDELGLTTADMTLTCLGILDKCDRRLLPRDWRGGAELYLRAVGWRARRG